MLFMHFLFASRVIANFKLQGGLFTQNEKEKNETGRRKTRKEAKNEKKEKKMCFSNHFMFHIVQSSSVDII